MGNTKIQSDSASIQMRLKRGVALGSSTPEKELVKAYGACQWWLSKSWLEDESGSHPMQQLWRQTGWHSDVELFLIGSAIYHLKKNGTSKEAFIGKRTEFLGRQEANHVGYLHELLTALLFQEGGNKVTLLPPSAAGYDLDVTTPDGLEIQVSCKVAQQSELSKKFNDRAIKCKKEFIKACQETRKQGAICLLEANEPNINVVNSDTFKQMLMDTSINYPGSYQNTDLKITIGYNRCPDYALQFSTKELYYTFIAASPVVEKREAKRIFDKIGEANKKFKKHAPGGKINLTVLRIPHYLSIEPVRDQIQKQFESGRYTNTSAVLLIQTMIVKTQDEDSIHINTAYQFAINQNADSSLIGKLRSAISIVQPLGSASFESPKLQISESELSGDWYTYMDAIESTIVPSGTAMGGSMIPGVRRRVEWEGTNLTIEMPFVPNEFKLL